MAAKKRKGRARGRLRKVTKKVAVVLGPSGAASRALGDARTSLSALSAAPAAELVFIDQMEAAFSWNEPVVGTLLAFADTLLSSELTIESGPRRLVVGYRTTETTLHVLSWDIIFPSQVTGLRLVASKDGGTAKPVSAQAAAVKRWRGQGELRKAG